MPSHSASRTPAAAPDNNTLAHVALKLWAITWRRKSAMALGLVIAGILGALVFAQATPLYSSRAQVLVIKKRPEAIGQDPRNLAVDDFGATHKILIESPLIIKRAIDKRQLAALASYADVEDMNLLGVIRGSLRVGRPRNTTEAVNNVLDLDFRSKDPLEATVVLDAILESYRSFLDETYRRTSEDTLKLVTEARDLLQKELLQDVEEYGKFRKEAELLMLRGKEGSSIIQDQLNSIKLALSELKIRKSRVEALLSQLEIGLAKGESRQTLLPVVAEGILRLEGKSAESVDRSSPLQHLYPLLMEEQTLLKTRGPNHPELEDVRRRIDITKKLATDPTHTWGAALSQPGALAAATNTDPAELFLTYLRQQKSQLESQESKLGEVFKGEYDAAKALTRYEVEDESHRIKIQRKEKLYEGMITRLRDVDLAKDSGGYDARVIAPPEIGQKIYPKATVVFGMAILLGLMGGYGLALLQETLDTTFRTADEVRIHLGLPVAGCIPPLRNASMVKPEPLPDGRTLDPTLWAHHLPRSVQAEAFRGVRTALFFSLGGTDHKVIQLTSAQPGDGKSTLSANLAVSLAQSGKQILLIDADLRKSRVHRLFGVSASDGLAAAITGERDPHELIVPSGVPNLSLLPAGKPPENPAELLLLPQFKELLDHLRERFDYIVVDTPPVLAVTDPCVVAPRVDGILLALRLNKGSRSIIDRARSILDTSAAKILGVIVNDADGRGERSAYGYGYGNYGYADAYCERDTETSRVKVRVDDKMSEPVLNGAHSIERSNNP